MTSGLADEYYKFDYYTNKSIYFADYSDIEMIEGVGDELLEYNYKQIDEAVAKLCDEKFGKSV